jgi:Alginate export
MCTAWAQDTSSSSGTKEVTRPTIGMNRWQEDWSVLADPSLRTGPFDSLKYIPIPQLGPSAYLSLGGNIRQRLQTFDAPLFGTSRQRSNTYLLDRVQAHADLRIGGWQAFVQFIDARAPGKDTIGPADSNRLDLEQAFVTHVGDLGPGVLKVRVGRQEMGFDLQRFVGARDGPNVRQAYDAVWADYEIGDWRIISFASHPVQNRDKVVFDDFSNRHLALSGFRVERRAVGPGNLAVYYLRYQRDDARFLQASGNERRNAVDVHYSGKAGPIDFDMEVMGQQGSIGDRSVLAWAFGERSGYTFRGLPWSPHLSLQFDAASGNTSRTGTFGTFNPLFPNGYYFSLADLTGFANLLHVKPIFSVSPIDSLLLQAAVGFQWRQTTRDAIYAWPVTPIANTAGRGSLWSGTYFQFDVAKRINENLTLSSQFVHYQVGDTIRAAGGRNVNYVNFQVSFAF